MITLFLMYVVFGVLQILLALPLMLGKVKPNGLYGFRVPSTLKDADLWYAVNGYAGRWLLITGIIFTLTAIILYLVPGLTIDQYALACAFSFLVFITISLVLSFRYLNDMKQNRSR